MLICLFVKMYIYEGLLLLHTLLQTKAFRPLHFINLCMAVWLADLFKSHFSSLSRFNNVNWFSSNFQSFIIGILLTPIYSFSSFSNDLNFSITLLVIYSTLVTNPSISVYITNQYLDHLKLLCLEHIILDKLLGVSLFQNFLFRGLVC